MKSGEYKAYRVSKKSGKECIVVAMSLDEAGAAVPDAESLELMRTYNNSVCSYGSSTPADPMPVVIAKHETGETGKSSY